MRGAHKQGPKLCQYVNLRSRTRAYHLMSVPSLGWTADVVP